MLSRLYQYAYITYVGGGFGKGIHNVLEAAVYGKPVFFGPVYHKFKKRLDWSAQVEAFSIKNTEECIEAIEALLIRRKRIYKQLLEVPGNLCMQTKGPQKK